MAEEMNHRVELFQFDAQQDVQRVFCIMSFLFAGLSEHNLKFNINVGLVNILARKENQLLWLQGAD